MKSLEKANCLLKANFSTKEISIVSSQGVRTVYQRKSAIRQKLGMEEKGDIVGFLSWLNWTKERNQERYTEIHYKPMEDGNDDVLLSSTLGDDG